MTTDRRDFLKLTATAGGALGLGLAPRRLSAREVEPAPKRAVERAAEPLRLLILGGTSFIGPHQVEYAKLRGHGISLFNRGRTNPDLFPNVETLIGDRNGDLASLEGKTWDVCIDNSASNPDWVRMSAGLLADQVDRYIYVSSLSAYADMSIVGMDEDAPTYTYESAEVSPDTPAAELPYGLAKSLSEAEALKAMGAERTTVVRPGLIVGPRDPTDRFTYWPARIDRGGETLAPGTPDDPTMHIDARDLARWIIHVAENSTTGTFNAVGDPMPMAEMLYGIKAVVTTPGSLTWVPADFLREQEVRPWADMPCWVPPEGGMAGFAQFENRRAVAAGLTFRPLAETARDTLEWHYARPEERRAQLRAGLSPERETEVLVAWYQSRAG